MIFRFIGIYIFLIPICSYAYAPPIGITSPGFGIDEVRSDRPSNWSSEVPGYYYIILQTGADSNTFGTPARPRSTIPNPLPAGSYVEVHGTYYNARGGSIMINARGTSGAWVPNTSGTVWIVGESQSNWAEFTSASIMAIGSYLYFDLVYLHSGSKISFGSDTEDYLASHGVFRNCEIEGRLSDGNSSWDNAAIHLHGATNRYVVNNTIYNTPSGSNGSSTAGTCYLYDNIVSEVNRSEGNHNWIEYAHSAAQLENMMVFQLSGQERIKWGSNVFALADYQHTTGKGANSNANDPRFANTAIRALNIVAGSTAEDGGVKHPVYDEFQRQYGLNINRDIKGNMRDVRPDHVAYEVGEGRAPPEAPTLLTNSKSFCV